MAVDRTGQLDRQRATRLAEHGQRRQSAGQVNGSAIGGQGEIHRQRTLPAAQAQMIDVEAVARTAFAIGENHP